MQAPPKFRPTFTAALGFLIVGGLTVPFDLSPSNPLCSDTGNVVEAPIFTVPASSNVTYPVDTVVRAAKLVIDGHLGTANAEPGLAPGLCIQAESIVLGRGATLCTGAGRIGKDVVATNTAAGSDGGPGGKLRIFLLDDAKTKETPALRIDPTALLCTGPGGDGGLGGVVPGCIADSLARADGGAGGDGGKLAITYAGPASGLSLPRGVLQAGAGGAGGAALAFTQRRDAAAFGGPGGKSLGEFSGIPPSVLQSALAGGRGGDGGLALAAPDACEPACDKDATTCLIECYPHPDPPYCLVDQVARRTCPREPGVTCDRLKDCRDAHPFGSCLTKSRDGPSDDVGGGAPAPAGGSGDNGHDADCSTRTMAAASGAGSRGDNGHTYNASGGRGNDGPVHGGNGGNAYLTGGDGGLGGAGGMGGNGEYHSSWGVVSCDYPCTAGSPGGAGGDSGLGKATGGAGGNATTPVGRGGDGGFAIAHRGNGGAGGAGGSGGFHRDVQCDGGCGGDGGRLQDLTAEGGKHGTGFESGSDGAHDMRGGAQGSKGTTGLTDPGSC
ncbi:MAG: hypothetical protein QOD77_1774 [Thermoplasmata archaeon]|jgi:hypothetical protein|nr:hypothetical protein [Thermoplasmata archaeon]